MSRYTVTNNENIDLKVEDDLNCIIREIYKTITPISIILTGSFGRGEATVLVDNGKLCFKSDYEICVVSSNFKTRKICSELSNRLSRKLGVETSVTWISPKRLRNNRNKNLSKGNSYPSIYMYELKAGSRILYGEDLINENVIKSQEINLWEGIKLLLNRMAETFTPLLYNDAKSYNQEKWTNKILLACGDCLLLHEKKYHFSYEERKNRLIYLLNIKDYLFLTVERGKHIIKAYESKLNGHYDWYHKLNFQELNQLVDDVLRFIIFKEMKVAFSSYGLFPDVYLERKINFYKFYSFNFFTFTNPLFENVFYLIKLLKWRKVPNLKIVQYMKIPFHHLIYSIIPPLYFFDSLSEECKESIIKFANKILHNFNESTSEDIREIKRGIIKIWFRICFGKNV